MGKPSFGEIRHRQRRETSGITDPAIHYLGHRRVLIETMAFTE